MRYCLSLICGALLLLGTTASAQEHPEEHPEKKGAVNQQITLDELATAITHYIDQDSKLKGGYFLVYDPDDKTPLALQLQEVHKDRLSSLGGGVYFACTDMKATTGTVYDLDFFMRRSEGGIQATDVAIHKKSGKARYSWKEENGTWKKVKS